MGCLRFVLQRPIFPGRCQISVVGRCLPNCPVTERSFIPNLSKYIDTFAERLYKESDIQKDVAFYVGAAYLPGPLPDKILWAEASLIDLSRDGPPSRAPIVLGRFFIWCVKIIKETSFRMSLLCWRYLSSRAVASQVLWAEASLTSVFGMGTGGPSP